MEPKAIEQIQAELLDVLAELPISRQEEVLDFALFLRYKEKTSADEQAQFKDAESEKSDNLLKAEFAEENLALTEAVMPDLSLLNERTILENLES